ncbi:unnamed protein product [Cunninghamella blakesleeana]
MKTVVIIGGGYAGVSMVKSLEKQFNDKNIRIILIESKTHFYHAVGGLRAAVLGLDDQVFIPYDQLFKSDLNKVIHAKAVRFDENTVYLDRSVNEFGDSISFDFLVIATGTIYSSPAKTDMDTLEKGKLQLQQIQQKVKDAKNILVIGGGPVGIEFIGEIIDEYKDEKKITLIHNNDQLGQASYLNQKANKHLLNLLNESNVQVLLNDRIELPKITSSVYQPKEPLPKTKNGVELKGIDLVLLTFGNRPNVQWVKEHYPELINQQNGFIKVKPTLQINHSTTFKNVFVIGDAADLDENKMAFYTAFHAALVTENISRLIKNPSSTTTDLKPYKNNMKAIVIPFGKYKGVAQLPFGIVVGNWMTRQLKGKTLFYDRYWKEMNQPVPSQLK